MGSVSARWMRAFGLLASTSVVWAMLRIHDSPWTALLWLSLALSAALWVRTKQVIDEVEAERVPVAVAPSPDRSGGPR